MTKWLLAILAVGLFVLPVGADGGAPKRLTGSPVTTLYDAAHLAHDRLRGHVIAGTIGRA